MKDFFISYNKADKAWAEWIAWTLEEAGYSVVIQAWDFRPGENFVLKMHESSAGTSQTIAILSDDYLSAEYTNPEWAAAFTRDPQGKQRVLIPVRVQPCNPKGLLEPIIYIDLIGLSEQDARTAILEGLQERGKPAQAPSFPSGEERPIHRVIKQPVEFPGKPLRGNAPSPEPDILTNLPTGIPFFTGREDVLTRLEGALRTTHATALSQRQAISGLGGIGKTQTALEYARRHRSEYKAVLWAVAESEESLISDFVVIATVLKLPEANVQDQTFTVRAVKGWLETHGDWLLILDNADDPTILEEFLPEALTGHVLLTSRAQVFDSLGILNPVELEEMTPDDAADFLLRRTGRKDLEKDEAEAVEKLAKDLDYLPLALEQAGAYIKELRGSFQDYLASYQQRGIELLEKGHPTGRYRKSVRTTWSLNFQQVEQASNASADLLRASAFLNPDRIPTELISLGASELGPDISDALATISRDPIALDEVLQPLIKYSLIHRDRNSKTYDIHRLVQAVLRDGMNDVTTSGWAKRVVKAMARVFPDVDVIDFSKWESIERLLPHAQACAELVLTNKMEFNEAAQLLNLTGRYLHLRGRLRETEALYDAALRIREKILEANDPDIAASLHNKAWLYLNQAKYGEIEEILLRALSIRESVLGSEHPDVAATLNMLGWSYKEMGRYVEANRVLQRSLEIMERTMGLDHIRTADSLTHLAGLYVFQGRYHEAKPLVMRSLAIQENALGQNHHELSSDLNNLALINSYEKNFAEAEKLFLRSIASREDAFGPNYPPLAITLGNLAKTYMDQEKYVQAQHLIERSMSIAENGVGADHPDMADCLDVYAYLHQMKGEYPEAENVFLHAHEIRKRALGEDHPELAHSLIKLGRLHLTQRKYSKGEPLVRRAIPILRSALGPDNDDVTAAMLVHASLLQGLNRKGEAQTLQAKAHKLKGKKSKKSQS